MMDWFRCYHGAPMDPKWRVVARRVGIRPGDVAAIWSALMDCASQAEDRGSVAGFDAEVVAEAFGYPVEDVRNTYETLRNMGVVTPGFRLVSWERRQPKSAGTSTDRVRRHRAKKKGENVSETGETNDETAKRPRSEQSREESRGRAQARDDGSTSGKTTRRLTDEERDLASAALGTIPFEATDGDVAHWRRVVDRKRSRGIVVPLRDPPAAASTQTVCQPEQPAPERSRDDELEIPGFLRRQPRTASGEA
jgi:hypothetical protein